MAEVSVVIVNFNSGFYLGPCIESLRARGGIDDVEIIVVDCASTQSQSAALADAKRAGARVIALAENVGYSGGCNRGFAAASGDYVVFANADLRVLDGALAALIGVLAEHTDVGMAAPFAYLDEGLAFTIPDQPPMTRRVAWNEFAARVSRRFALRVAGQRLRRRLGYWRSTAPIESDMLSGAFLAARRDAFEALGGFDAGYPLYYEDSDLCRRARFAGWRLLAVPAARIVHFARRSGFHVRPQVEAKMAIGRHRLLRRHYGALTAAGDRVLRFLAPRLGRFRGVALDAVDLGAVADPPRLDWGGERDALVELAFDPEFLEAAGHLCHGAGYELSPYSWRSLAAGHYYLRALALPELEPLGSWRLCKG